MDRWFWVGLALAIPISIVANLLTHRVQQLLLRLVTWRSARRIRSTEREFNRIFAFHENPALFRVHMSSVVLSAIVLTAILFVFAGVFVIVVYASRFRVNPAPFDVQRVLHFVMSAIVAGYFTCAIIALVIITVSINAAITYSRVVNFEQFRKTAEPRMKTSESTEAGAGDIKRGDQIDGP
jgi:hypothetical protein